MPEKIYTLSNPKDPFDGAAISLDSSLKWQNGEKEAENLREKGFGIVWDIKVNLFSFPLSDEAFFKTVEFTLDHFKNILFPRFEKETKGVILYQGSPDFPIIDPISREKSPFQKKVLRHKLGIDYIKSLAASLPDILPLFLLFDEEPLFISETCFEPFCIATKNPYFSNVLPTWGWNRFSPFGYFSETVFPQKKGEEFSRAVVLPPLNTIDEPLLDKLENFLQKNPSKIIPEAVLTENWQGIDTIFVFPKHLTHQGKRKVAGFEAASGKVLEVF